MAIPDCLAEMVGLRGACTPSPSMIFINDMPDSGIARMESMSDQERGSFVELWNKVYGRSIVNFQSDIRKNLSTKVKTNPILRNTNSGSPVGDGSTAAITDTAIYGQVVTAWGSPLMNVVINAAAIAAGEAVTGTILIYDLDTGEQLHTQAFDLTNAGAPILPIEGGFSEFLFDSKRRFFVGISLDSPPKDMLLITPHGSTTGGNCGTCCAIGGNVSVQTGTLPLAGNHLLADVTFTDELPGIYFSIGLRCSLIPFICDNSDVLNVSLRYKAYSELLMECLDNDSLMNRYVLTPADKMQERIQRYEAMYQSELTGVLESITYHYDTECWECKSEVEQVYLMP